MFICLSKIKIIKINVYKDIEVNILKLLCLNIILIFGIYCDYFIIKMKFLEMCLLFLPNLMLIHLIVYA